MTEDTTGFALPFRIAAGGGVAVQTGVEKLRDNVVHILFTSLGERAMNRDYGAGLRQLVHDPINDPMLSIVQHQVIKAIALDEPRVEATAVRIGVPLVGQLHRAAPHRGGRRAPGADVGIDQPDPAALHVCV